MTTKRASKATKGSKDAQKGAKKSVTPPGPAGWQPVLSLCYEVQQPYDKALYERYCVIDGTSYLWVKRTDKPYSPETKTLPRTERRFYLDCQKEYTGGQWAYEADMKVPAGSNAMSIMQIHTGDEYEKQYGSTAFMLFWFSSEGGSVHHYSGECLASNLVDKCFHLKVAHDLHTYTVTVWIDHKQVWTGPQKKGSNAPGFYMKDGVYVQKNASDVMEVYLVNTMFWKNS